MTRRATVTLSAILLAVVLVVLGVIALLGRATDAGPTAAPSPSPSPDRCTAQLRVTGTWPGGFGAELVVATEAAAPDWRLSWSFEDGSTVTDAWGGTLVAEGADGLPVQVSAPDWARDLAAGQSATVGFNGAGQGADEPRLDRLSLNGVACDLDGDPLPTEPVQETAAFYVDPDTQAAAAAETATGEDQVAARRIAGTPQARWVTDPDPETAAAQVAAYTAAAAEAGRTGVLVVYAIPGRDCGAHSAGGTAETGYLDWVARVADAIEGEPWVVLEPDALAQLGDCTGQGDRAAMLRGAAALLDGTGARVYLDAGHAGWLTPEEAAERIELVGTEHLTGFALNVSNYLTTDESVRYGEVVSQLTGDLGYLVDSSRNGNGSTGEWCNPRGRALGEDPHLVDNGTALDAVLWIKPPGESDGTCNGGPPAGQWWPEIARELVANAGEGQ